ncbi:MAG: HAD family hydrolase [Candidatus Goldbacteria bacterium]|nr:HAD family hydrolase [Candidatus Goldiibacteriota bacterium]
MKKKVIFFDLGETLVYRNPSLVNISFRFLKKEGYNIPKKYLSEVLNACALKMRPIVESGKISDSKKWEIYISMVFKKLNIKNKNLMLNLMQHLKKGTSFRLFSDVKKSLIYLKKKGFKLGIISNASPEAENILKRTGIYDIFDSIIISEKVGFEKPDVNIYKKALKTINVLPEETIFVGDNFIADIKGAIKANITPVWLRRKSKNNEFSYDGNTTAKVFKIKDISGLIKLIKKEGWN